MNCSIFGFWFSPYLLVALLCGFGCQVSAPLNMDTGVTAPTVINTNLDNEDKMIPEGCILVDADQDLYEACIALTSACDCSRMNGSGPYGLLDCDDNNDLVRPGVGVDVMYLVDPIDGIDNDCDGRFDEDEMYVYRDGDGDGYVNIKLLMAIPTRALGNAQNNGWDELPYGCDGHAGAIEGDGYCHADCDDTRADVHPDALEIVANGRDDNCDTEEICYSDLDGDHFGSADTVLTLDTKCSTEEHSAQAGDCDDHNATINPMANELKANGVDENCNLVVDEFSCQVSVPGVPYNGNDVIEVYTALTNYWGAPLPLATMQSNGVAIPGARDSGSKYWPVSPSSRGPDDPKNTELSRLNGSGDIHRLYTTELPDYVQFMAVLWSSDGVSMLTFDEFVDNQFGMGDRYLSIACNGSSLQPLACEPPNAQGIIKCPVYPM